jgi:crotonobetainyl-CoA:carnitine CoA-transferase CaiB-like acyl-CoA transferase
VTIDLASAEGQELVQQMAVKVDIFIENFKVGDLARKHLDYETLSRKNSRLIYCSITGYGQSGPYAERPAYDPIIQAMGGFMAVTGTPGDGDGSGPAKVGPSIIDIVTAMTASNAILAAVAQREQTGRGQYLDIALLDSGIAALSHLGVMYLSAEEVPARLGTDSNGNAPSGMFKCADGAIMVVVGNEDQFRNFCVATGCPQLIDDPHFTDRSLRIRNLRALRGMVEQGLAEITVDQALERLATANVPAGRFNELPAVFEDPQVIHRNLVVEVPHPQKPDLRLMARAAKMSDCDATYTPPPLLGQHTDEVLRDFLGKTAMEIAHLRDSGVI